MTKSNIGEHEKPIKISPLSARTGKSTNTAATFALSTWKIGPGLINFNREFAQFVCTGTGDRVNDFTERGVVIFIRFFS